MNPHSVKSREVRRLRLDDIPTVTAIFNEAFEAGETTADVRPRTAEQISAWLTGDRPEYESYVCEESMGVTGWAAIARYHEREAYSPTVELSVYVARSSRGAGVGRGLMWTVLARAKELGFHSAVLILFPEPEYVIEAAKRLGFVELGRLEGVYPAEEKWRDIVLMQMLFGDEGRSGL